MPTLDPARSRLLVIDLQARLMPAIEGAEAVIANAGRLVAAAGLLGVPVLHTEQNPRGLGPTVPGLGATSDTTLAKTNFDATREPGALERLAPDRDLVVAGCEAHVCVLQTVLGLLAAGRRVHLVRDALGARRSESRETAILRMARHGAEVVTTEMVVFEWLGTSEHPRFREALALVK